MRRAGGGEERRRSCTCMWCTGGSPGRDGAGVWYMLVSRAMTYYIWRL